MKTRIWLLLSVIAAAITWIYAARILVPWDRYIGELHDGVKSQMGDLYPRWVGTRELLLHGRNPYGPEVSGEIQMAFYGRIVTSGDRGPGHKILDEQRFAYPVYVVFLMAPTMYVDFAEVQRWAPTVLGLLAALSVPICLNLLGWKLSWEVIAAITLFTVSSPQIVQGLLHQQLSVVVGFLIFAGAWCVRKNYLATAGVLLAWSTIKPQMALFPLCFFLAWVIGNWRKRWRLVAGFMAMLLALIGAGEFVLPGWIGYFLAGAAAYRGYFPTTSLLRVALGDMLGEILGGLIVLGLLVVAWRSRKEPAGSRKFTTTFAAFLMGTLLAFPLLTPFNQVMLIFPAMLLLQGWKALPQLFRLVFIVAVSWPWITSSVLLLFPPRLDSPNRLPLLPSLFVLFFPLILPLLLMTRRRATLSQLETADLRPS
ncbi:MAG: glycosyltransferase family 87 protein [Candidatus Sulfotelmatobacter sp.]